MVCSVTRNEPGVSGLNHMNIGRITSWMFPLIHQEAGGRWSQSGFSSLCMAFVPSFRPAVLSVQTCCLLITSWLPGLQPSVTHAMFKGRKQGTPVRCRRFLASLSSFVGEESSRSGAPQQMSGWSQGSPCSRGDWENELLTFSGSRVGARQEKGTVPAARLRVGL